MFVVGLNQIWGFFLGKKMQISGSAEKIKSKRKILFN